MLKRFGHGDRDSDGAGRPAPVKLHVGSGAERLEGWVNIDIEQLPGVDLIADATEGLPFEGVEAIYAEHFLEHLHARDGLAFLAEAHRALAPGGRLRLSTPNLDWVWASHYDPDWPDEKRLHASLGVTRAFHGWGHRFLWNRPILTEALEAVGFAELRWLRHGEHAAGVFEGVERHQSYGDHEGHHHVLVVEAVRLGAGDKPRLMKLRELINEELTRHVPGA